jgi:Tol biopolymer transport system component
MWTRRYALAALTWVCVAMAVPAADATYPGGNGSIAFTATLFGAEGEEDSWIVSVGPDGERLQTLAANADMPAYRPDGRMIAFSPYRKVYDPSSGYEFTPPVGIHLMRANGAGKRRLIAGPYTEPDWSPDGKRLVFTRTRKPRGIVTWQRGQLRWLTSGSSPAWSPTGRLIAFSRGGPPSIYVMRPDGSGIRRIGPGFAHEWFPNGRRLIFTRVGSPHLYSIHPSGSGLRLVARVPRSPVPGRGGAEDPIVSPDGTLISYAREQLPTDFGGYGWNYFIWTMAANGEQQMPILDMARTRGPVPYDLDWQPLPPSGG